ncbi:hypothetical protein NEOLEDRAFT_1183246 [Neolentinus lepideus HHB14362 ss-1]|uniref:Uncharacterized protein n=1 Tax=Neolentinus lepideus HHB14362 ss-1 TaxID=1314782 RepID=A0A165NGN0_9AGAM|nr:hypothetical protein NEOLEDRAFT_1183246 [Neolentinus lepideus HHB14362 ss-1]
MANTRYPVPTAIVHGSNNFPKMISECHKIIKDLEEVNYVQFTMVENLRLNLDEAQEDLRKEDQSVKPPEQSDSISPAGWGSPGMGWGTESIIMHGMDSTAVPSHALQSKGGGELKEQVEEPPTMTAPTTKPMITMVSFVDTPTNEVFLKLVEKHPELAPRDFQKGIMTMLKVRANWWCFLHHASCKLENTDIFINFVLHIIVSGQYKAAIDNEEVMKAAHRLSPNFTGNPTNEAQVIKYLAECRTWTVGLSYDSAVELGELRSMRHAPMQDPFTN